jgi:hypothetical protein
MFFSLTSTSDDGDSATRDVSPDTSSDCSSEAIKPTQRKSALNSAFVPSASDDDVSHSPFLEADDSIDHISQFKDFSSGAPEQASDTDVSISSRASYSLSSGDGECSVSSLEETTYDESGSVGQKLRITYLLVTLVIMLADGLQGM